MIFGLFMGGFIVFFNRVKLGLTTKCINVFPEVRVIQLPLEVCMVGAFLVQPFPIDAFLVDYFLVNVFLLDIFLVDVFLLTLFLVDIFMSILF